MLFVPSGLALPAPLRTSFCSAPGWQQVWSDEFSGITLNSSNWRVRRQGNVDRMAKVMEDDIYLEGGALVLRTQQREVDECNYTSGAVDTRYLHSWRGATRSRS